MFDFGFGFVIGLICGAVALTFVFCAVMIDTTETGGVIGQKLSTFDHRIAEKLK